MYTIVIWDFGGILIGIDFQIDTDIYYVETLWVPCASLHTKDKFLYPGVIIGSYI